MNWICANKLRATNMQLKGQCHCGNVKLTIPYITETATECNCSICSRYAAIWGYFTQSQVSVSVREKNTDSYCWGDKDILFSRCPICGCITHYSSSDHSGSQRLAVNYRMFDKAILNTLEIKQFDGADTWAFIKP